MKICLVGAELLHADRPTEGQTDMTKLIVTFLNFVNVTKNETNVFENGLCVLKQWTVCP